jgi:hypothetical protein
MGKKNIYETIRELLGEKPGNLNILEEKIDINLQMEYFDYSKKIKNNFNPEFIIQNKDDIFNMELDESIRKTRLTELASINDVTAYRTIEKYLELQEPELRSWAVLALQESRMLLESRLLDENQVFISTGLGGKKSKLRYFVVLVLKSRKKFSPLNKKVIRNEFEILVRKYDAEIEQLNFFSYYVTLLIIIPLTVPVKEMLREAVNECNQYGNFLQANFIVTNVRELSEEEINNLLKTRP